MRGGAAPPELKVKINVKQSNGSVESIEGNAKSLKLCKIYLEDINQAEERGDAEFTIDLGPLDYGKKDEQGEKILYYHNK